MSSQTSSLFEALHQILASEIKDYRQLVALTESEQVALQQGNLSDLMTTTLGKESLMPRLAQWEQARQRLVAGLSERLQLPAASLSELVPHCDRATGQNLWTLRQEFINLVDRLQTLNRSNHLLLQTELVRVNATLNFVLPVFAADSSYGQSRRPPLAGNVLNWQI